jgi:hypothetical protein
VSRADRVSIGKGNGEIVLPSDGTGCHSLTEDAAIHTPLMEAPSTDVSPCERILTYRPERLGMAIGPFRGQWKELRDHLREDKQVSTEVKTLSPHEFDTKGLTVAATEAKAILDMELAGSGSLNTRGSQLAGLTGATVALVATAAPKWFDEVSGDTEIAVAISLGLALLFLLLSIYVAIFAVLPTSRWRKGLERILREDLAAVDGAVPETKSENDVRQQMLAQYLDMADKQRIRNHRKADDMLWAYCLFFAGVLAIAGGLGIYTYCVAS